MIRLLFFGNRDFLRSSRRLLEGGGIQAIRAERENDAERILLNQRIDVLLIEDKILLEERKKIAVLAKSLQRTRIIFLYRGSISQAESADALLTAEVSIEDLILTIQRLAGRSGERTSFTRNAG